MERNIGLQGGCRAISNLVPFILSQLRACGENPDNLLPVSQQHTNSWVATRGTWDLFLFQNTSAHEMEPIEKARGLWYFVQTMDLEDSSDTCNILKCQSRNRIHFCGFIADLLIKLELQEFSEALDSTIMGTVDLIRTGTD